MSKNLEKFASQANPEILAAVRQIAANEGRHFQSALDEAMRDYIDKKKNNKPRPYVLSALHASINDFDNLYNNLAK